MTTAEIIHKNGKIQLRIDGQDLSNLIVNGSLSWHGETGSVPTLTFEIRPDEIRELREDGSVMRLSADAYSLRKPT